MVEDVLVQRFPKRKADENTVLILVVVEDVLVPLSLLGLEKMMKAES